jgi:hypothetical protein
MRLARLPLDVRAVRRPHGVVAIAVEDGDTAHPDTVRIANRREAAGLAQALEETVMALKAEDFGVLSDTDVQAAMKDKLGVEMPRRVADAAQQRLRRTEPASAAGRGRAPAPPARATSRRRP